MPVGFKLTSLLSRIFSFSGRANRVEFIIGAILLIIIAQSTDLFFVSKVYSNIVEYGDNGFILMLIYTGKLIINFAIIFTLLALLNRRLHDQNISGWWATIGLIVYCATNNYDVNVFLFNIMHDDFVFARRIMTILSNTLLIIFLGQCFFRSDKFPNRFGLPTNEITIIHRK